MGVEQHVYAGKSVEYIVTTDVPINVYALSKALYLRKGLKLVLLNRGVLVDSSEIHTSQEGPSHKLCLTVLNVDTSDQIKYGKVHYWIYYSHIRTTSFRIIDVEGTLTKENIEDIVEKLDREEHNKLIV